MKQAAQATGKSRPTILRAIQSSKISAARHEITGAWQIDPAELHRVYPLVHKSDDHEHETEQRNNPVMLEVHLLRERLADKDAMIAELREDRDQWRNQAQRLAIQDQRAKAGEVIAMPPPAVQAPVEAPPAPPARVSPPPTPADAPAVPAADNQPQQYPARVVVKKAPKRTPKADAEVSWWRKMMGGR
ncbi:MAG: hypothetical protein JOZ58_11845 [Acetobacteraceae bacterium]|nr:hypothetical protein [Acetobacteraceae bacterium]